MAQGELEVTAWPIREADAPGMVEQVLASLRQPLWLLRDYTNIDYEHPVFITLVRVTRQHLHYDELRIYDSLLQTHLLVFSLFGDPDMHRPKEALIGPLHSTALPRDG
jgi:hypothetical protein